MAFEDVFLRGITTTVTFQRMREVQSTSSGGITHEVEQSTTRITASIHPFSGREIAEILQRSGEAIVARIHCRPSDVPFELRDGDLAEFNDGRRIHKYRVAYARNIGQRGKVLSVDVAENVTELI